MGAVTMPLKIVCKHDEEQEAFPHKVTLTGDRAARVRRQAVHFPEYKDLIIPEWDGKFDLFQISPKGLEFYCTDSPSKIQFLKTLYQYPTALVVELQYGAAKSAPRDVLEAAFDYVYDNLGDFEPLCGPMTDSDAVGTAMGSLAYRSHGSLEPRLLEPVEVFKEMDSAEAFFYVSQSNPDVWLYLYDRWVQGRIMIDSEVEIPEVLQKRLKPVEPTIRLAGSDSEVVAYVNY